MPFQHRGQWRPRFVSADKKKINEWHFTNSNSPRGQVCVSLFNAWLNTKK